MRNYMKQGKWSSSELYIKDILKELGYSENTHYLHNWKLMNEYKTGYFELDFMFPKSMKVIEVSPSIWHNFPKNDPKGMGNVKIKDERKIRWLKTLKFDVLVLNSKSLSLPRSKLKNLIYSFLHK